MSEFKLLRADMADATMLCRMFLHQITTHPEYISHGEIQMGVGEGRFENGRFITNPSPNAEAQWMKYIGEKLTSDESAVFKAVDGKGEIIGFCVAEISEDGADPFGVICDIIVRENLRTAGVGTALLNEAIGWLNSRNVNGVYLESGLANHPAHEYFIRRGFQKVSEIYKLM
jgi:ribosomal protein S18 acetylase RimI-like enzyme